MIRWYYNRNLFKYLFILVAVFIAIGSLVISNHLIDDIAKEEHQKIELWAEATRLAGSLNNDDDMGLVLKILSSNDVIPVILCNENDSVISSANIALPKENVETFLNNKVKEFRIEKTPIIISETHFKQYVYYEDSKILKRLYIYPYIQMGVLLIFIGTSFLALLSTKKAEQNKVWVGLSKETAHQLGTPISSLLAWTEYLRMKKTDESIISEIEKDVNRLQVITDRFSKIGSAPAPELENMQELVLKAVGYLEKRISKKVHFEFDFPHETIYAKVNESLFGWVIENITKNAVDAMEGQGTITYTISENEKNVFLDISDTGKGIHKSKFNTVFIPGFTTKSRGWGLGLSLVKRIIESYHNGKIYVKVSELNVGTTFRIEFRK